MPPVESGRDAARPVRAWRRLHAVMVSAFEITLVVGFVTLFLSALETTRLFPPVAPSRLGSPITLVGWCVFLLVCRRIVRGESLGGFQFPAWMADVGGSLANGWCSRVWRRRQFWSSRRLLVSGIVVALGGCGLAGLVSNQSRGLTGRYYASRDWSGPPLLVTRDRVLSLRRPYYDLINPGLKYSIAWSGVIFVPTDATYGFGLVSDGRSDLWLDSVRLMQGGGGSGVVRSGDRIRLIRGFHEIQVRYSQPVDAGEFAVTWQRVEPGVAEMTRSQSLSRARLFPETPGTLAWALYRVADGVWQGAWYATFAGFAVLFLASVHWALAAGRRRVREHHAHFLLQIGLAAVFLYAAFLNPTPWQLFGFRALGHLGPTLAVASVLAVGGLLLMDARARGVVTRSLTSLQTILQHRPWLMVLCGLGSAVLFFTLRNEFVNSDGRMLRWFFPQQVSRLGADVSLDEMWETYLHSRFWAWSSVTFGWSVRVSYQVLASLAGGVFLVLLWRLARRLWPSDGLALCLVMLSGGYMQLFFGDVENYTLVAVVLLGYYLASVRYLHGGTSVVAPTAWLALAMTFHMLAGFLLLSLAYLYRVAGQRHQYRAMAWGGLAFVAVFAVTVWIVELPLEQLLTDSWTTSSLRELTQVMWTPDEQPYEFGHWAWFAFDAYHWEQYNLLGLYMPAHVMVLALLWWGRIARDQISMYLLWATGGMMLFLFNYKTLIGVFHDWNLYANAAIPLALLLWYSLFRAPGLRYRGRIVTGWALLSFLHTASFVLGNHTVEDIV